MKDGMKPKGSDAEPLGDTYAREEEWHMQKALAGIDLPNPHRLGPVVLFTDYLNVVAELYSTVMTYQQALDGLQKQNRYLMAKVQSRVDESKPYGKESKKV